MTATIISCPRCSGTGELPKFRHIEAGRCFLCNGSKTITVKDLDLPPSTVVCYQDNRKVTHHNGEPWPDSAKIERFSVVVNGGHFMPNGWDYVTAITDANREACRALWAHAKATGCECRAFK